MRDLRHWQIGHKRTRQNHAELSLKLLSVSMTKPSLSEQSVMRIAYRCWFSSLDCWKCCRMPNDCSLCVSQTLSLSDMSDRATNGGCFCDVQSLSCTSAFKSLDIRKAQIGYCEKFHYGLFAFYRQINLHAASYLALSYIFTSAIYPLIINRRVNARFAACFMRCNERIIVTNNRNNNVTNNIAA